jgi:hypothetical protein
VSEIRPITDIVAAIRAQEALGREHYAEIATHKGLMAYAPDLARYAKLQALGGLLGLAMYEGDQIIGYSVNILTTHLHYQELRTCQNDLLYLRASERQGARGLRLIRATKQAAAKAGAQLMLWHAKEGTPMHRLLVHLGCTVQDIILSEVL